MQKERPLSPHLMIYKPQLTSMLSFLHRSTGVFLFIGTPLLVYWLWSISEGPAAYQELQSMLSHPLAQLILLGWVFSLFYHLCNGVRHLFWDVGRGYELDSLYATGKFVVVAALLLTAVTAYMALKSTGGLS